ncbi:MAG: hypothetical protein F6K56_41150 [Moorea sp. SIO3G5]|nr:hypothetical protein [Moorena sp. SIO3G5]
MQRLITLALAFGPRYANNLQPNHLPFTKAKGEQVNNLQHPNLLTFNIPTFNLQHPNLQPSNLQPSNLQPSNLLTFN